MIKLNLALMFLFIKHFSSKVFMKIYRNVPCTTNKIYKSF